MTTEKNTIHSQSRIKELRPLISPIILLEELPCSSLAENAVKSARQIAQKIMLNEDPRLLVVVGPCSIHDPEAALEYAQKLAKLAKDLSNELFIIMRVYFEKPRTSLGWKGLINDPRLNNSFDINTGLRLARKLLLDINSLGLPTATEFVDTITPTYLIDLISWGAIGARTTESQMHRELASGLPMPIGFKNGTSGDVKIAIDAVIVARHQHHFLGITRHGNPAIIETQGNPYGHIILRGGKDKPNYDEKSLNEITADLTQHQLPPYLMVDCSHDNSQKNHLAQADVLENLCAQIKHGNQNIKGIMLESHLQAGRQSLFPDQPLIYGQSITDACLSWDQTVPLLEKLAQIRVNA
ncbi:MAG: 3-deoxy-7-phosphoheptulonate synthase [Gammaproteobacteria bacterium]|nr:3-deoxy-7-phosphoheptulonate synthase [Gammaproteobacteria bacterium]